MRSETRHRLKEDQFARATGEAVHWTADHRNTLLIALVAIILLGGGAYFAWMNVAKKDAAASAALGNAIRIYNSPVGAEAKAQVEAQKLPGIQVFATGTERAKAAQAEFAKVANEFGSTANGKYARYMEGVAAIEAGDTAAGERILKDAASNRDKEISTLAKFALASLYATTNRHADATNLYKEVADANSVSVPKTTAKLEMAAMLEAKQPAEAIKIYEEIKKDEEAAAKERQELAAKSQPKGTAPAPTQPTQLAQLADQKIQQLRQGPPTK